MVATTADWERVAQQCGETPDAHAEPLNGAAAKHPKHHRVGSCRIMAVA
eukprot:CAMPEP_0181201388 /NCGR_PEP_ID=MMETSP1096-20121128/18280_1 /TAXON_ID=156174 ORGANISM="Chrysochromulina ericina, Strain CCMP281" /NCGR_SAMPLE_ID=MMETSP1096 /ASSEMBLY_ACC=CAM_ASM_000453 /LENGTH=48 /DNA_ID= /DNA_START= /DNA_END= /DNA_ORIENTATION=